MRWDMMLSFCTRKHHKRIDIFYDTMDIASKAINNFDLQNSYQISCFRFRYKLNQYKETKSSKHI